MGNFTSEDIKLAQDVQAKYGIPASVTLAQYALESGYGKSTVGANNYFNIKGTGNGGYQNYTSKAESFDAYGKLLSGERYTSKTSSATNVQEYVQGVKNAGYAEDPNYVSKVMGVVTSNNLTQYDSTSGGSYGGGGAQNVHGDGNLTYINQDENGNLYKVNKLGLEWWGDIVVVVFSVMLLIAAVLCLSLAVMGDAPVKNAKKKIVKKVVGK